MDAHAPVHTPFTHAPPVSNPNEIIKEKKFSQKNIKEKKGGLERCLNN